MNIIPVTEGEIQSIICSLKVKEVSMKESQQRY